MNKRTIAINVIIWVAIFMFPIIFLGIDHRATPAHLFRALGMPVVLLIAYFTNYLWLAPSFFMRRQRKFYWVVNILMITALAVGVHFWFRWAGSLLGDEHISEVRHLDSFITQMLQIMHNMFVIGVSAAIATSIQMSLNWVESEKAREETKMALREAQLENIRYQVNPHFMLNTLNNIYALVAFDQEKAQTAIMELSKLMRHVLYDNKQTFINLKDDLEFINNYINLMKLRLSGEVDIDKHFDIPTPCHINVAPLIFIPLVENAFKHGISPTKKSFIHISITASEEQVVCFVENSYYPKTVEDQSGHGIGLQHVQKRLDLSYPDKYQWERYIDEKTNTYKSKITLYDTQLHYHR